MKTPIKTGISELPTPTRRSSEFTDEQLVAMLMSNLMPLIGAIGKNSQPQAARATNSLVRFYASFIDFEEVNKRVSDWIAKRCPCNHCKYAVKLMAKGFSQVETFEAVIKDLGHPGDTTLHLPKLPTEEHPKEFAA